MKKVILIELPTWLGDAVMTTTALEALASEIDTPWVLVGSPLSLAVFAHHPQVIESLTLPKSALLKRLRETERLIKYLRSRYKILQAVSFRRSLTSRYLISRLAPQKAYYQKHLTQGHQVERYFQFIRHFFKLKNTRPGLLKFIHRLKSIKLKQQSLCF